MLSENRRRSPARRTARSEYDAEKVNIRLPEVARPTSAGRTSRSARNTPFQPLAVAPSKMTTATIAPTGHAVVNRLINPAATAISSAMPSSSRRGDATRSATKPQPRRPPRLQAGWRSGEHKIQACAARQIDDEKRTQNQLHRRVDDRTRRQRGETGAAENETDRFEGAGTMAVWLIGRLSLRTMDSAIQNAAPSAAVTPPMATQAERRRDEAGE
jgi:hypothetical protein